jgi:hypothetical protein
MMKKIDPAFNILYYTTIKKDLGVGYQETYQAMKALIDQTYNNMAITTDL